ncbi:hypothetical protein L9F63_007162, partial [Diploptera punctata]
KKKRLWNKMTIAENSDSEFCDDEFSENFHTFREKKKESCFEHEKGNESNTWLEANKSQKWHDSSENVDISSDNSPKNSKINKLKLGRRPYGESERRKIIEFIIKKNAYNQLTGNIFWQMMEANQICPGRTWQSLKEHFRKKVLPMIEKYGLSEIEVRKFKSG